MTKFTQGAVSYQEELLPRDFRRGVDGIESPSGGFDQFRIATWVETLEERFNNTGVREGEDGAFVSCTRKMWFKASADRIALYCSK